MAVYVFMAKAKSDAVTPRYFLLDMGKEKYGDAILCLVGGKTILVDGGHTSDFEGQPGSKSLPAQIKEILGATPHIDLLICTHCHLDHIGCLPKMIKNKTFTVGTALVADEKLGWGKKIAAPDAAVLPDSPIAARVVAALREEPRADDFESDAAIERFLQDAVTLESNYKSMLKALEDAGTKIIRYGRNSVTALLKEYAPTGLTILGPTKAHLEICRKAIATSMQDAIADTAQLMQADARRSDVAMYRRLTASTQDALADGSRLGSALNNQSIVIALGPASNRVLLTGDMQFADPAVNGLDAEMTKLRKKVKAAGPYKFAKLAHHGSHNGFDDTVRQEWGATKLFAVSGGSEDTGHPAREVLKLLKTETASIKWARTDKNGRIELKPSNKTKPLTTAKGQLNDATANKAPDDLRLAVTPGAVFERVPGAGPIEITAKVPDGLRRVVITIESDGGSSVVTSDPTPAPTKSLLTATLGGGRILPPLLFASNRQMLADNIGIAEARTAIDMIEKAGQTYVDVPDPDSAQKAIYKQLTDAHRGVVLVGGYDILPAKRLDTLPAAVRSKLGDDADVDADGFIVWSDSLYGDKDADDLPELPVSRIPDGKSSQLVLNALTSGGVDLKLDRFSIFNSKRPFATDVIKYVPGLAAALRSLPSSSASLPMNGLSVPLVYFMLHGYDNDATRFAGQEPEYPDAFDIDQVPATGSGVVFTGCCWGALTVRQIASRVPTGKAVTPRTPDQSIALRYLRAGYNAFIGCTGSHYSPPGKNMSHGKPMHVAFWKELVGNVPPAEALFRAKVKYLKDMPHGMDDLWDVAVEHKILRQFTCLGLGW